LPDGYVPWNIAFFDRTFFVSYVLKANELPVEGRGMGVVNIFGSDGSFNVTLAEGGILNIPTVMFFGRLLGGLSLTAVIGNFGDGRLYFFDYSGAHRAPRPLTDCDNNVIRINHILGTSGIRPPNVYFASHSGPVGSLTRC